MKNYNVMFDLPNHIYLYINYIWREADRLIYLIRSSFWQTTSICKVTCEETEISKYIMHSQGALEDFCFTTFPMRQDSMWVSSVWRSHCIPVRGGPPTWSRWWSKYCCRAVSPPLACRVNGWALLSQLVSRSQGMRWRGRSRQRSPSSCESLPLCPPPALVRKLANSSQCLWAWFELGTAPCLLSWRQTAYAPLEPKAEWGPEGMRCLLTPVSQDDALSFLPFHTGHQAECSMIPSETVASLSLRSNAAIKELI